MNTKPVFKCFPARLFAVLLGVTLVMTACVSPSTTPQVDASSPILMAGEIAPEPMSHGLVDIGGRNLWFQCVGHGSPTVILEAGGGDNSTEWYQVQTAGDLNTRLCSYDRANLGLSDEVEKPRTFVDMAHDLHTLLVNARIAGPYILVGHSMGGSLVRVFKDLYPEEVVGLVLVESAHPDMGTRLLAALPQKSLFESKAIRMWRRYLAWQSESDGLDRWNTEGVDLGISNEQARTTQPLGDLPLVVLSRSPFNYEWAGMPALPMDTNLALIQTWQDLQSELAGLSSNSTQVIATHAGHMIPTEEPDLVVEAIRNLLGEVRLQMGLPASPAAPVGETHAPEIIGIEDRPSEQRNGSLVLHKAVIFSDQGGDAIFDQVWLVSASVPGDYPLSGGFIPSSSEEQQNGEAIDPFYIQCLRPGTLVIEAQIVDQAFTRSEPVQMTFTCPGHPGDIQPLADHRAHRRIDFSGGDHLVAGALSPAPETDCPVGTSAQTKPRPAAAIDIALEGELK